MLLHIFALPSSEFHSSYKALQQSDNIRKTSVHFNETPRARMSTVLVKSSCECWLSLITVTSCVDSNNYHRISQRTVYLYRFTSPKCFASRQAVLTEAYHGAFTTVVCSQATNIFFPFPVHIHAPFRCSAIYQKCKRNMSIELQELNEILHRPVEIFNLFRYFMLYVFLR